MSETASIEVAAGIIWQGCRFLACQRPDGKPLAGYWEFPGGKIIACEDAQTALKRELQEELDIIIAACSPLCCAEHFYAETNLKVRLHFFEVHNFAGEPQGIEGQNILWTTVENAAKLDFLPVDLHILQILQCRQRQP